MEQINTTEKAIIRKEDIVLKTYPYSDPSPIPEFGRLYPYNRFDGYTDEGVDQSWEMIVMENDHIKVWINPAVGGKIWAAVEKSTGKEFIYFNHSAKFRDVAMRGPWTSGGMEINMGIIGHAPSCSALVDCEMVENEDGSVSCFVGATDWPSRTEWRVEVHLAKDAAFFSTRSWWHNNSCLPQAYYQWNNVGVKAAGNLEYIFPGQYRVGHDGTPLSWPIDDEKKDLSFYNQNDYGEYKSYHIFGSYSDFWGCYWHDDQFGMGHSSSYDQKPGKKIWIWGLSRYGMIWEDLLTDHDGQYSEVQSGRLFNQSVASSSKTPFKHRSFLPYSYDTWEEHWFPIKNTSGLTYGNTQLSFYITKKSDSQQIHICANQTLNHTLRIEHRQKEVLSECIQLQAMENCSFDLPILINEDEIIVRLNQSIIYNGPEQHELLSRPVKTDPDYKSDSTQALFIQAKEWERQRFFERALAQYHLCLDQDPFFLEALTGLAGLYLKQLKLKEALVLLRTALSVDTYDPEANYLYGLVNDRLQHTADAKDGFSIASQSVAYKVPSFVELAKIFLREGQIDQALAFVKKAQMYGPANLHVSYLNIVICNLKGQKNEAIRLIKLLLAVDPINYLAKFELSKALHKPVSELTVSELPYETYIELASFYYKLNLYDDAIKILDLAPDYAMVSIWKAYLYAALGSETLAKATLDFAASLKSDFVFPHREEDINILEWAIKENDSWKFKYYTALAYIQNLRKEEALSMLNSCGQSPEFYSFYIVRANLKQELNREGCLSDLEQALVLDPKGWRSILRLSKYYAQLEDWTQALSITKIGCDLYPNNYYLGLNLAKCLMHTQKYDEAISLMAHMTVLPNEGASEGRDIWRETHLLSALDAMEVNNWKAATDHIDVARIWPENMGIGKPYHVDERLEDFMQMICLQNNGDVEELTNLRSRIMNYRTQHNIFPYSSADFISIILLREAGYLKQADEILGNWLKSDPNALTLRWCVAFLKGDRQEIDYLSSQRHIHKEVLPYETRFDDNTFLFVKKLSKMGAFIQKQSIK